MWFFQRLPSCLKPQPLDMPCFFVLLPMFSPVRMNGIKKKKIIGY
ncbi:hypothetical protein L538_0421 [Bordetella hinzii 4161]|nr:hypothetical protein L538_0421 [Bordetella hinzii 4161]